MQESRQLFAACVLERLPVRFPATSHGMSIDCGNLTDSGHVDAGRHPCRGVIRGGIPGPEGALLQEVQNRHTRRVCEGQASLHLLITACS